MAWTYLAESAESPWPYRLGCDQLPTVNQINSVVQFYCRACQTVQFLPLLSGMTLERSFHPCCREKELTLSMGDFPARISALQELEQAWQDSEAGYFLKSLASFGTFDQPSYSWKMSQLSLFEGWTASPAKWPRAGMIVDGTCYELQTSERRTKEIAGGYLPTPTARDYKSPGISRKRQSIGGGGQPLSVEFKIRFGHKFDGELRRMDDGLRPSTHRIKALGNAVVPAQARQAFTRLMGIN